VANRNKRSSAVGGGSESLEREVADLLTLATRELREKWSALCGVDPPDRLGRTLLIRAIAYRLQEKALGGLKPSAQRILDRVCDEPRGSASGRITKTRINAGAVLIREWRGSDIGSRCSITMSSIAVGATSRSRKLRAQSPAAAGQDHYSLVSRSEPRRRR
jgi:hypothetical protein